MKIKKKLKWNNKTVRAQHLKYALARTYTNTTHKQIHTHRISDICIYRWHVVDPNIIIIEYRTSSFYYNLMKWYQIALWFYSLCMSHIFSFVTYTYRQTEYAWKYKQMQPVSCVFIFFLLKTCKHKAGVAHASW